MCLAREIACYFTINLIPNHASDDDSLSLSLSLSRTLVYRVGQAANDVSQRQNYVNEQCTLSILINIHLILFALDW